MSRSLACLFYGTSRPGDPKPSYLESFRANYDPNSEAEAFMCQTLCSGTLSFETVVKNWVPAAKAVIQAWQGAH